MKYKKPRIESIRKKTYTIIYGTDTVQGKLFDLVLLFFILTTVLLFVLDTVQSVIEKYGDIFYTIEFVITIFFSLDYILRILCHPKPKEYIFSFYGIIDECYDSCTINN